MQIEPIFPQAVIGLNKLKVDHNKILKYLENIEFEKTGPSIQKEAEAEAYVSKNYNILENINYLKDEIYINIKNYLNNIMKLKIDIQITTSWATKTFPNGYSQKHRHNNSFLSGVYYPVGDKNFSIKFYKKNSFWNIENIEPNNLNVDWYGIDILEDSVLILFPSDLKHSIQKNLSDKTRYSIAFNTFPFGKIGKLDGKINLK
jgi:uncharacterized protein (TIGR02466 family)